MPGEFTSLRELIEKLTDNYLSASILHKQFNLLKTVTQYVINEDKAMEKRYNITCINCYFDSPKGKYKEILSL